MLASAKCPGRVRHANQARREVLVSGRESVAKAPHRLLGFHQHVPSVSNKRRSVSVQCRNPPRAPQITIIIVIDAKVVTCGRLGASFQPSSSRISRSITFLTSTSLFPLHARGHIATQEGQNPESGLTHSRNQGEKIFFFKRHFKGLFEDLFQNGFCIFLSIFR